jgi:hypothetical protein
MIKTVLRAQSREPSIAVKGRQASKVVSSAAAMTSAKGPGDLRVLQDFMGSNPSVCSWV